MIDIGRCMHLGPDTPAVDVLADIGLADADVDRLIELHSEATDEDGWLILGDAQASAGEPHPRHVD